MSGTKVFNAQDAVHQLEVLVEDTAVSIADLEGRMLTEMQALVMRIDALASAVAILEQRLTPYAPMLPPQVAAEEAAEARRAVR